MLLRISICTVAGTEKEMAMQMVVTGRFNRLYQSLYIS
jgi:hypothetical protein